MVLDNVRAFSNGNNGVYVCGCLVQLRELTARDNGGHGVLGMLTDVDAYSGLSDNDAGGIKVDGRCNLCQWTAAGNTGNGIEVGSGSTVRSCTACGNTGDGILVSSNCRVIDNTCESNIVAGEFGAVAGIHATGSGNRIEDNHVIGNNIGIDVDSTGNLITKNSAQGNGTNYDIASGNTAGPTLGTGDIVSDNPHANYEF
jgi:parallel beta-helix repeat protein